MLWRWFLEYCYDSRLVEWSQEPCIRVNTRELDGVLVTECLPYIHLANNWCYTNLAYSKETYSIISLFQNFLHSSVIHDGVTVTDVWHFVTVMCDIMLNPNPKFKK